MSSLGRCHHPVGRMTVTTTRTEPSTWGPDTRTFGVSSMFNELQPFATYESNRNNLPDHKLNLWSDYLHNRNEYRMNPEVASHKVASHQSRFAAQN